MAPKHGNDTPRGGPQEHRAAAPSTDPIPLARRRRTPRRRTLRLALRHHRPARLSTVWSCAQDDYREGTGLLATWLLIAVVKIVTTYTQPGQRVLLLDPAPYLEPSTSRSTTARRSPARPGPYAGLREAGWTVVRLGRGVQTHTAVAPTDPIGARSGEGSAESESGLRPNNTSPTADRTNVPTALCRPGPDSTATGFDPDRYDLVITAAEPPVLGWFHPTDWAGLLTPNGTLAVITRSDHSRGRLTDPASSLGSAAHHAGLRYLDRIALLRVPIRDGVLAVGTSARNARPKSPVGPIATPVRHTQVHDDLLVFTRQPAPAEAADGEGDVG